jgi:hypothetical protein
MKMEQILPLLRETAVEREIRLEREVHVWRVFTDLEWVELEQLAAEKDAVSERVSWTRRWNAEFNLLGEVGEEVYARVLGIERTAHFGDGGEDFPNVDVKATSHCDEPRLLRLLDDPLRAAYFCLVAVDLEGHRGRYVGWATREELAAGEVIEYGFGPTRTLRSEALHQGLPPAGGQPIPRSDSRDQTRR